MKQVLPLAAVHVEGIHLIFRAFLLEPTLAHHHPVMSVNIRYYLQMALCRDMAKFPRLCSLPRQEKGLWVEEYYFTKFMLIDIY